MALNDLRRANARGDDGLSQKSRASHKDGSASFRPESKDSALGIFKKGNEIKEHRETQRLRERMKEELDFDKVMITRRELGYSEEDETMEAAAVVAAP